MSQLSESDRVKAQAETYYNMEPETLHDIISTAGSKYQRLRREAEDLQMKASAKTRAAKGPGGNLLKHGA